MMIQWKAMSSRGKRRRKETSAWARTVARKARQITLAKVTVSRTLRNLFSSKVNVEIVESMDTKLLIVGTKQPKPQGNGKGTAKSKVSEVSESGNSKHVEETWT